MFSGHSSNRACKEVDDALEICEGWYTKEGHLGVGYQDHVKGVAKLDKLEKRTTRLLKLHSSEIKLIAEALLKERTLSKRKVLALVSNQPKKSKRAATGKKFEN
jgi:hypothetical protein